MRAAECPCDDCSHQNAADCISEFCLCCREDDIEKMLTGS
jgi:hypothetical protein